MKIAFKFLVLVAVALGIHAPATAQTEVVTVGDSTAPWLGFMNVFELPSVGQSFDFGSPWGVSDLVATFDDGANTLDLTPNTIADPNEFWYQPGRPGDNPSDPNDNGGPGALGNKFMDANLFQETTGGALGGVTVQFDYNVLADTTTTSHEGFAFIRDFEAGFGNVVESIVPLTPGAGSVSLTTIDDPTRVVQYGFAFRGENVWSTDVAPFGGIQIATNPVAPPAPIAPYFQDFNSLGLAGTDATALASGSQNSIQPAGDGTPGWGTFGNVFDSNDNFKFGYGTNPAPNEDPGTGFSNVAVGQGADGAGDQYLNAFSDYSCCDLDSPAGSQQGHGDNGGTIADDDIVRSSLFQERTITSADVGRELEFSFDIKLPGDFSGSGGDNNAPFALGATNVDTGTATGTAEVFIKTLDPNSNFSESGIQSDDVLTEIAGLNDVTWVRHTLSFTIDPSMEGHILQFGIESTSQRFDPTGVYLDNISLDDAGGINPDFDGDGDVDGRDFLAWQRSDGTAAGLAAWQGSYPQPGTLSAATAVPEPSTAIAALLALVTVAASRRHS